MGEGYGEVAVRRNAAEFGEPRTQGRWGGRRGLGEVGGHGRQLRRRDGHSSSVCRSGCSDCAEISYRSGPGRGHGGAMILITGATGTIGSEIVRQLAARGERVRAVTRNPDTASVPDGVEVVHGDYTDVSGVARAMKGA